MAQNIFRLVLTDEAQDFIESLPEAVSYKIYYNIKRVAGGERNKGKRIRDATLSIIIHSFTFAP